MGFEILTSELLVDFMLKFNESPYNQLNKMKMPDLPVDYFQFYKKNLDFLLMTVQSLNEP